MLKEQNKSQHKAGLKRRKVRDYFFSCIPFFSNEFLESLTFWDWLQKNHKDVAQGNIEDYKEKIAAAKGLLKQLRSF